MPPRSAVTRLSASRTGRSVSPITGMSYSTWRGAQKPPAAVRLLPVAACSLSCSSLSLLSNGSADFENTRDSGKSVRMRSTSVRPLSPVRREPTRRIASAKASATPRRSSSLPFSVFGPDSAMNRTRATSAPTVGRRPLCRPPSRRPPALSPPPHPPAPGLPPVLALAGRVLGGRLRLVGRAVVVGRCLRGRLRLVRGVDLVARRVGAHAGQLGQGRLAGLRERGMRGLGGLHLAQRDSQSLHGRHV